MDNTDFIEEITQNIIDFDNYYFNITNPDGEKTECRNTKEDLIELLNTRQARFNYINIIMCNLTQVISENSITKENYNELFDKAINVVKDINSLMTLENDFEKEIDFGM